MPDHEHPSNELVTEDHGPAPGSPASVGLDLDRNAPTFASLYGRNELAKDKASELVSLGHLPGWGSTGRPPPEIFPSTTDRDGHGVGEHFSAMLGHGLRPGEMLAIGAASAGAGKTAWLMQLVDGLALRNERVLAGDEATWGKVLTPLLVASEMSIQALTWRSLARWTGHSATIFRGGRTVLERRSSRLKEEALQAWAEADTALQPSAEFARSRAWLRLVNPTRAGSLLVENGPQRLVAGLAADVEAWRDKLAKETGREVVPVVVLDPLQRYQGSEDAIDALNALSRALCSSTVERQWITLVTSDTNKASAKGDNKGSDVEDATAVFRGSYNLMHEVTAAVSLRRVEVPLSQIDQQGGVRVVEAVFAKQRWGSAAHPWPRFVFDGQTMRFFPLTREETEKALEDAKQRTAAANEWKLGRVPRVAERAAEVPNFADRVTDDSL